MSRLRQALRAAANCGRTRRCDASAMLSLTKQNWVLHALVEVHTEAEMNRDSRSWGEADRSQQSRSAHVNVSYRNFIGARRSLLRPARFCVSESGLTPEAVRRLQTAGYRGFFGWRGFDAAGNLKRICERTAEKTKAMVLVKVCGITNLEERAAAEQAVRTRSIQLLLGQPTLRRAGNSRDDRRSSA